MSEPLSRARPSLPRCGWGRTWIFYREPGIPLRTTRMTTRETANSRPQRWSFFFLHEFFRVGVQHFVFVGHGIQEQAFLEILLQLVHAHLADDIFNFFHHVFVGVI